MGDNNKDFTTVRLSKDTKKRLLKLRHRLVLKNEKECSYDKTIIYLLDILEGLKFD